MHRRNVTLLLSADGYNDIAGQPWLRLATPEEAKAWRAELEAPREFGGAGGPIVPGRTDVDELFTHDGQQYVLVTVNGTSAPDEAWCKASGHLRVGRLS